MAVGCMNFSTQRELENVLNAPMDGDSHAVQSVLLRFLDHGVTLGTSDVDGDLSPNRPRTVHDSARKKERVAWLSHESGAVVFRRHQRHLLGVELRAGRQLASHSRGRMRGGAEQPLLRTRQLVHDDVGRVRVVAQRGAS